MSGTIIALASGLVGLLAVAARLFFWFQGKKMVEAEVDEKDVKILKRQRDNDVSTFADADAFWVRKRKDTK